MMRRAGIRSVGLLYCFAGVIMSNGANSKLTSDDLQPVLEVISRLAPLKLTDQSGLSGFLGVCFSDDEAFRELNPALGRYTGNAAWLLVSRPPDVCLVAVAEEAQVRSQQPATELQLKELILRDVGALTSFLEQQLRVAEIPSKGIQPQKENDAAVATIENGLGGPTLLVSDPDFYILSGFRSTSPRDRTVSFWMSEQELDGLYGVLDGMRQAGTGVSDKPILRRASESTHENFVVLPSDVVKLKEECEAVVRASKTLKAAMERVIRICNIAQADRLGIVVIGG